MQAAPGAALFIPALIGAASGLAVTLVAGYLAVRRYLRERGDEQKTLLNALAGELANLHEHYTYASRELPPDATDLQEIRLRLQWSIYGPLHSSQDVSRYGFLTVEDIGLLLQLSLRIRNTDILLQLMLEDPSNITPEEIDYAADRMEYAIRTTGELLRRLERNHPRLKTILNALERDLRLPG